METLKIAVAAVVAAIAITACSGGGSSEREVDGAGDRAISEAPKVRLGYFPNLTHAPAIIGVENGTFADAVGGDDVLELSTFSAGPAAIEALFAGALDATFIGPNPAINAFVRSDGKAVRIVAGATSGGAALVVRPDIDSAKDLKGKKVATPQLGGTQDVALRSWLAGNGLKTDPRGGGDVSILPQENAQSLETFAAGQISGAWVPEPWATRLVQEGGGKVLVDEASLWPDGRFVTTHLLVRTEFLEKYPATVERLITATATVIDFAAAQPEDAKRLTNAGIQKVTGKSMAAAVIDAAWPKLTFTTDPIAASLKVSAAHAEEVGLLDTTDLDGIYALGILNEVRQSRGEPPVTA